MAQKKKMQGREALLTEKDRMGESKFKNSNPNGHLRREEIFDQFKKENKILAAEEAAYRELEDCTF